MLDNVEELVRELGLLLLLFPIVVTGATLLAAVLGVLTGLRIRPPAFLWLLGPTALLGLGAAGLIRGVGKVREVLPQVDFETRATLASAGLAEVVAPLPVGMLLAGGVLAVSAVLLGLGTAVGAGDEARGRSIAASPLVGALLAALIAAGGSVAAENELLMFVGGLAAVAGLGAAAASARSSDAVIDAERVAVARVTATLLAVLAVASVAGAFAASESAKALGAVAFADPAARLLMSDNATDSYNAVLLWSGLATAVLALSALPPIALAGLHLAHPRAAIDAVSTAIVGLIGLAFLGAVGVGVAPILREAGRVDFVEQMRPIALPHPRTLGVPPNGTCLLTDSAGSWVANSLDEQPCQPEWRDALVAVPATSPARRLVGPPWDSSPRGYAELMVVSRSFDSPEPGGLLGVPIGVRMPAGIADPIIVVDDPLGERVYAPDGETMPLADDTYAPTITRLRTMYPDREVVLVPGGRWTIQDVIDRCAKTDGPCVIAAGAMDIAVPAIW